MKKEETKRLSPKDQHLVDYILSHPELSETACIMACGWAEGSVTKVIARVRSAVDVRKAQNSAKVDKKIVKELTGFDALQELAEIAQSWRTSKYGAGPAHVRAAELYLHISGETPEAKKISADIKSRQAGGALQIEDDFRPDWAKTPSVN